MFVYQSSYDGDRATEFKSCMECYGTVRGDDLSLTTLSMSPPRSKGALTVAHRELWENVKIERM